MAQSRSTLSFVLSLSRTLAPCRLPLPCFLQFGENWCFISPYPEGTYNTALYALYSLLTLHLIIQALCSEGKEICYLGSPPDYKEQTEQIVWRTLWWLTHPSYPPIVFSCFSLLTELSSWQTAPDKALTFSFNSALPAEGSCVWAMHWNDQHGHHAARLTRSSSNCIAFSTPLLSIYIFNIWLAL